MAKLKPSATKKTRNASYALKGNAEKNAKLKLARHLKKHPNDKQAQAAVGKTVRKRKTPIARLGWVKDSVKDTMAPTPVTRGAARVIAQVLAFSSKIARMQYTKAEQKARRKLRK